MIKDIYREEKNKDVYTDVDNGEQGSYTNDYVKWLENLAEKQVKNIAYEPVLAVVIPDNEIEDRIEEAGKVHWGEYGSGYESGVRTGIYWAIDKMNPNNR